MKELLLFFKQVTWLFPQTAIVKGYIVIETYSRITVCLHLGKNSITQKSPLISIRLTCRIPLGGLMSTEPCRFMLLSKILIGISLSSSSLAASSTTIEPEAHDEELQRLEYSNTKRWNNLVTTWGLNAEVFYLFLYDI